MLRNFIGNRFTVVVLFFAIAAPISRDVLAQVRIPARHDQWKFTNAQQSPGWEAFNFQDLDWQTGTAPLGFGEPELATVTFSFKDNEKVPIATYFRTEFQNPQNDDSRLLRVKARVDDGYIAYLNGEEIHRWNIGKGPCDSQTLALKALSEPEEQLFRQVDVVAAKLQKGKNVLAFEVHQCNDRSTDLYFDVRLSSFSQQASGTAIVVGIALESSLRFNSLHRIEAKRSIPNGFLDGGREMQVDEFGNAISARELLRIDRTIDDRLQDHLNFASSVAMKQLNEIDRATRIARYIDRVMTPPEGIAGCMARSIRFGAEYASREVLLGDVADLCGSGVCRHRALLFKLMALDE